MFKRIAIVLEKNLSVGEVGNVAAILMGQAASLCPEIYDTAPPKDQQGNLHAAIQYSTVVLKAGEGQIVNLAGKLREDYSALAFALFSRSGQSLHNEYPKYKSLVTANSLEELQPVGIVVVGDDDAVRTVTKKFSLLK